MADLSWTPIATNKSIKAKPSGLWTKVSEYIAKGSLLKIEVMEPPPPADPPLPPPAIPPGHWSYANGVTCGPDGDYGSNLTILSPLTDKAPVGALIGKIGGSTTDKGDATVLAVGSFCVLRLSDTQEGALFLTINDSPKGFADNDGEIQVTVSVAT